MDIQNNANSATELQVEQRGPVLWLTITREERRNAMSHGVLAAMAQKYHPKLYVTVSVLHNPTKTMLETLYQDIPSGPVPSGSILLVSSGTCPATFTEGN